MFIYLYYTGLAVLSFCISALSVGSISFLFAWIGLALAIVSSAYVFKKPSVFRKTQYGTIPFIMSILLLPFIIGVHLYNIIASWFDKTDRIHHIKYGVHVGSRLNSSSLLTLEDLNIKAIVDMTAEFNALNWSASAMEFEYLNIPVLDHQSPKIEELRQAITWIENQVEQGHPIVVHCALGRGRSVFVVAAYMLAKQPNLSVREVLENISKIRHFASLNPSQLKTLVKYHNNNEIQFYKTACLIANPVSGGGKWLESQAQIINQLSPHFKLSIKETTKEKSATEYAKQAQKDNVEIIIAAGGDGTLREVAQQLVNTTIKFGIIPLGTANALAHHLYGNVSKVDPIGTAVSHIMTQRCEKIDTAVCNNKTVLLLAGIGLEHEMIHNADRDNKNNSGQFAYLEGFFRGFAQGKAYTLTVQFDEQKEQSLTCTSFVAANAAPFTSLLAQGNGSPNVKDGLLDVTWIKPSDGATSKLIDFAELVAASFNFRNGNTPSNDNSNIQTELATKVTVKSEQLIQYVIDGEVFEDDMVIIESNPQSLNIFMANE
ncbi:diacylglycerol kinase family protein [Thalassotalea profundi]|uniref:Diacylglycerol kinase catalytic subunit n=1 Tax=Thalassotalea profundi TaxID=2036687 RepID=A0ABQ3IBR9_9GAMM|nr:diacylglycerol kinase family protein [Thalassotalea profundi]GHE77556.1 diacylglycerol kinase catalytic subunit [Thalassotalea profundi]